MRRLLMVPPTYYGVEYEINPWMDRGRPAHPEEACRQWEALRRLLEREIGAQVLLAQPVQGLPDMVFTANAGLIWGRRVVVSSFRHPERQGEEEPFAAWFEADGFEVVRLPRERHFEGEGDALFLGDTLYAGYRWRSDVYAHRLVGELLDRRVLSLELTDPYYYHLDTCFCPLDGATVAYFPGAFDAYARAVIEANAARVVCIEPAEAARFACNAVVVDRHVALNTGCPRFEAELRRLRFEPHATPLDEFLKAGGSAKCLVLHLDRGE